jgi:DNA-binding MarR family transcriptional regulator
MPNRNERPFLVIFQIGLRIQHLNQRLESWTGISLTQWALLQELVPHPGISPLQLSERLGVQPSTMTPALARLERKGLVFVGKDPKDGRKKAISLTRKGKETIDAAERLVISWRDRLGVDREELIRLRDSLDRLD